ncbi:MAG: UvrD-helicase domain-containing protein [Nitrospinota bacterium]
MAEGAPLDAAIRERARTLRGENLLVEAGAGTGKTTLLVDRLLDLLEKGDAELSDLVVITFTEKAAAELAARIRSKVERRLEERESGGEGASEVAERMRCALEDLERTPAQTIHGFCASLLREFPLEAGVSPSFDVLDELAQGELIEEAWAGWLSRALSEERAALRDALALGLGPDRWKVVRDWMVEHRDLLKNLPDPMGGAREEVLAGLGAFGAELAELFGECTRPEEDKLAARFQEFRDWAGGLRGRDELDLLRAFEDPYKFNRRAGSQKNWSSKEALEAARAALRRFQEELLPAWRARLGHNFAARLLAELRGYVEEYERLKAERGLLDFLDLLLRARDLLRDHPEVRGILQGRFRHLLVDEFQDTDPLQVEVVFFLAERAPRARQWEEVELAPGKLFLVGDPKQSIYRFRRADIEMYERAKERLGPRGSLLPIQVNFRSVPGLLEWVNALFERLIQKPPDGAYQPDYTPLLPWRAGEGPRVFWLPECDSLPPEAKVEERCRKEAEAIASLIFTLTDPESGLSIEGEDGSPRAPRYDDFGVLFRKGTHLRLYEEALRAAGIPFRVEGSRQFYQRQEVKALLAALRAVENPRDRISLAATLRSPLFGFSDEEVFLLARAGWEASAAGLPELEEAVSLIEGLHRKREEVSFRRLVSELLAATRAPELFLCKPDGEGRLANLLKVLDLAEAAAGTAMASFGSFVRWLSGLERTAESYEGAPRMGEAPADEGALNCVHLLTIHKAKGLEFPIVILADLASPLGRGGRGARVGSDPLLCDRREGRVECSLGPLETAGFAPLRELDGRRELEEEKRLFYVAATRARDYLFLPPVQGEPEGYYRFLAAGAPGEGELGRRAEPFPIPLRTPPWEDRPFRAAERLFLPGGKGEEQTRRSRAAFEARRSRAAREASESHPLVAASELEMPGTLVGKPSVAGGGAPGGGAPGGGAPFGELVHFLLARVERLAVPLPAEFAVLAEGKARALGLGAQEAARALGLVEAALSMPTLERARRAPACPQELPFVAEVEGVSLQGQVDLLFEEEDALVVVDFKTDAVAEEEVDARLAAYRLQGGAYALGLEAATGKRVGEVRFLFLAPRVERRLPLDEPLKGEVREALRSAPHSGCPPVIGPPNGGSL